MMNHIAITVNNLFYPSKLSNINSIHYIERREYMMRFKRGQAVQIQSNTGHVIDGALHLVTSYESGNIICECHDKPGVWSVLMRNEPIQKIVFLDESQLRNYKNHCWNCSDKVEVNSISDITCNVCGWVKCSKCNKCKINGCESNGVEIQQEITVVRLSD
jgi:hypothetical protein